MISEKGKNLIFVLSTPRSGSTLLSTILGSHSKIFSPPEYWLLLPFASICDDNAFIATHYDHELARNAWSSMITKSQFNQAVREFSRSIYNSHLSNSGKEFLVDKTPRYYHIVDWLDELFPQALKLWIKRNPLDVFASTKRSWEIQIDELVGEFLSPHSLDYTISFRNLNKFFEDAKTSENKYILTYEGLVTEPSNVMEEICDFLGIPFEEEMVNYGNHKPDNLHLKRNDQTLMGDRNIENYERPHQQSIGNWKQTLSVLEVQKILDCLGRGIFEDLGYEHEYSDAIEFAGLTKRISRGGWKIDEIQNIANNYNGEGGFYYTNISFTKISRENNRLRRILFAQDQLRKQGKLKGLIKYLVNQTAKVYLYFKRRIDSNLTSDS